jgi:hypothetical protein
MDQVKQRSSCQVRWCVRTHLRSYARFGLKRRSSQPASHALSLASPSGYLWSNVECTVEHINISVFERMACVRTQARDLSAYLVL